MWKLKLEKGQKLFFTSDTHYNHKNICRGVSEWEDKRFRTRDFNTLDQMNDTIVNNINELVGKDDILIHLGDWSFGGLDSIPVFRERLLCETIYLIYGNHDHHIEDNKQLKTHYIDSDTCKITRGDINENFHSESFFGEYWDNKAFTQNLFVNTSQYQILDVIDIDGSKYSFVLSHYPICSWHDMNRGRMHLFGHVHLPSHKKIMQGKSMDVGMDGNDLKPYELSEIISLIKDRPVKANILPSDHHEL